MLADRPWRSTKATDKQKERLDAFRATPHLLTGLQLGGSFPGQEPSERRPLLRSPKQRKPWTHLHKGVARDAIILLHVEARLGVRPPPRLEAGWVKARVTDAQLELLDSLCQQAARRVARLGRLAERQGKKQAGDGEGGAVKRRGRRKAGAGDQDSGEDEEVTADKRRGNLKAGAGDQDSKGDHDKAEGGGGSGGKAARQRQKGEASALEAAAAGGGAGLVAGSAKLEGGSTNLNGGSSGKLTGGGCSGSQAAQGGDSGEGSSTKGEGSGLGAVEEGDPWTGSAAAC